MFQAKFTSLNLNECASWLLCTVQSHAVLFTSVTGIGPQVTASSPMTRRARLHVNCMFLLYIALLLCSLVFLEMLHCGLMVMDGSSVLVLHVNVSEAGMLVWRGGYAFPFWNRERDLCPVEIYIPCPIFRMWEIILKLSARFLQLEMTVRGCCSFRTKMWTVREEMGGRFIVSRLSALCLVH